MLELTDENFEEEITKSNKPVLVDFFTDWCSPCSLLSPILEKLAEGYKDKLTFAKVNLDVAPLAAQKYGIEQIPKVILFKNGKPVSGFVGVRPQPVIKEWLEDILKENKPEPMEKLIKEYEEYARQNGLKLNPNREVVERLVKGLLENEKKYGQRYCPCRRISGNPAEDKSKICPCQFMPKEIAEQGQCLCGLFWKE